MLCAFCNEEYISSVGCCAAAAMDLAMIALQYHVECDHQEVKDAIAQLRKQEPHTYFKEKK